MRTLDRLIPSFLKKGPTFEERLQSLYNKLAELDEIRSLSDHPGWQRLSAALRATITELDRLIIIKSESPVENEKSLVFLRSNRDAIQALFAVVDGSNAHHKKVEKDIFETERIIEDLAKIGVPLK